MGISVKANPVGCTAGYGSDACPDTICGLDICMQTSSCLSAGRWYVSGYADQDPATFWIDCGSTRITECTSADRYHPCSNSGASASGEMKCLKDRREAVGSCWDPIDPTRVLPAVFDPEALAFNADTPDLSIA